MTSSVFDQAVIMDWSSVGVFQKDQFFQLVEQLETEYIDCFEANTASSTPSPSITDVSWKLGQHKEERGLCRSFFCCYRIEILKADHERYG